MPESERLVKFHILGQDLTFYTGATEEEVKQILSLVEQLIEEHRNHSGKSGTLPVHKVAVLTCLNLASRYIKLQHEFEWHKKNTENTLISLNERLDIALTSGK